jgi:hypothetical protein
MDPQQPVTITVPQTESVTSGKRDRSNEDDYVAPEMPKANTVKKIRR